MPLPDAGVDPVTSAILSLSEGIQLNYQDGQPD